MTWNFSDLEAWDDKIAKLALSYGLDWFPITYEVCDYYEMIGHMSYHGMPSHYQHWSFGKKFERTHQMYNLGAEGLPYELIINSNPSIAYLMKQNALYLQILIMAHCVGHSDFFKNNRMFKETRPESIVSRLRNARKRIQKYTEDPLIGLKKVESFLDNVHTISMQTERNNRKRLTREQIKSKKISEYNSKKEKLKSTVPIPDLSKSLLEPDRDLLSFLIEHGKHFEDWQLDILSIVRDESQYFLPQIKTKIINEGWASFWHYKLMNELDLPQDIHIPFLKTHNQVIRPHLGGINPYHIGFHIFKKIEEKAGLSECFLIREIHEDISAVRVYLDEEDIRDLNLFTYSKKEQGDLIIDDVADEEGWKKIKSDLIRSIGDNSIPKVIVSDMTQSGKLILNHVHDGRDLDLQYANPVVDSIQNIWPENVKFFTIIEEEPWEI